MKELIGAVDVGGTKIAVGLVTPQGEVAADRLLPSRPEQDFDSAMADIASVLRSQLQETGAVLSGIGIGCTGQVDPEKGQILKNGFLPKWSWQNPVQWLGNAFRLQVGIENDAAAAALAEWRLGAGERTARFLYVTVGTGIGGALILDGELYRGANGQHPELGHHVIDPGGLACFCGSRGCWETLASGRALGNRMRSRRPGFSGDAVEVCDLAESGDPLAGEVVAAHAGGLGTGMANLITLYAPEMIALGGGLMRRANLFMPGIVKTVAETCHLVHPENTHLVLSKLGDEVGLVGAAQVYSYRFDPLGSAV